MQSKNVFLMTELHIFLRKSDFTYLSWFSLRDTRHLELLDHLGYLERSVFIKMLFFSMVSIFHTKLFYFVLRLRGFNLVFP